MTGIENIITQLKQQKEAIDRALSALKGVSLVKDHPASAKQSAGRPTRKFSAATRRKMALAQQRRYAALRGETAADESHSRSKAATPPKPAKRAMSAQGLANIRAGVKKRLATAKRAAAAAKKTAGAKKATPATKTAHAKRGGVKRAAKKPSTGQANMRTTAVQVEAAVGTTTGE